MARSTFFSFHYQRDVWRVNQIRNAPNITGCAAAGFHDSFLWETAERKGESAIKKLIDKSLEETSVTVVCIGARTAGQRYINYEIEKSIARGNGLLGVHIHNVQDSGGKTDSKGDVPFKLLSAGYKVHTYSDLDTLARWIEAAATAAEK